jgi:hypothetical protein
MSFGNTFENDLLLLIFNGTAIADIAENDTTSPATVFYLSLHTSSVADAGSQTTNEIAYTGYARVSVNRNSGGWTVASNVASNTAEVSWPACAGSSGTASHWALGTASSGTGKVLVHGSVTTPLAISTGITPRAAAGVLTTTLD